ncbi:hypothetical protein ACIQWA_09195 [Kitasatospora sp. NPDC098652]|uniref:hypothetical protein n=1 Tax=Kitasatospora sp. NPDC098652 TaxID=3364095 RepID=UPI00380CF2DA
MPEWTGGLAHAIAAVGIVTAALTGAAAPDDTAGAQAGPDRYGTATAPATAPSEVLGTGPSYLSVTAAQDTQGPSYLPS